MKMSAWMGSGWGCQIAIGDEGAPVDHILAFNMGDYFMVYGGDAMALLGYGGIVNRMNEPIPAAIIPAEQSVVAFGSILLNRGKIALVGERQEAGAWNRWKVYDRICNADDLKRYGEKHEKDK